jgi:predicted phosphodiesterase
VREQRVIDAIVEHLPAKSARYKPLHRATPAGGRHEFVLLLSDLHAGEVVSAEETGGFNSYDWGVMLQRLERLRHGVLSYAEHRATPVTALRILGLGDMLSGNIHDELRETNSIPLAEATVQLGLDLADWVEEFVPEFPEVTVDGVVGNHPREFKKPQSKRKFSNADWTTYQIMRQRLSRSDVRVTIPKAQRHLVDVLGRRILMTHGDSVGPSSMVGVPTGGIVRHVARLRNQYASLGRSFDHFVCGHFHEPNVYRGKLILVNGSVIGPNEYGLERFGEAEPPTQLLLPFNEKYGLEGPLYVDLG